MIEPDEAGRLRLQLEERFMAGERASLVEGFQSLMQGHASADLMWRLHVCLFDAERTEEAMAVLRSLISSHPSDRDARNRLTRLQAAEVLRERSAQPPGKTARKGRRRGASPPPSSATHELARAAFDRRFPGGFSDPEYLRDERDYKVRAHEIFHELLPPAAFAQLIADGQHAEVADRLLKVNSGPKLNLIHPTSEGLALRDVARDAEGARVLAEHVYQLAYGTGDVGAGIEAFALALDRLNRPGKSPVSWPNVTLFSFIAFPDRNMFVKPAVTQAAAAGFRFELNYKPRPNALTYGRVLAFARALMEDLADLKPRDLIDIQSFIWVTRSRGRVGMGWCRRVSRSGLLP